MQHGSRLLITMSSEKPVTLKELTVLGREHIPSSGGFMILPSQLGYFDLLRLELLLEDREVIYLVGHRAALHPLLRVHLEKEDVQALVVSPRETEPAAYREVVEGAIKRGAVVIYLPAEASAISSPLTTVPGAKLEFLLKAGVPVLPLHVHRRQDTVLPIGPRYSDAEVVFTFGALLTGEDVCLPVYQERLMLLAEQCMSEACPSLDMSLGYALIQGFKKHGTRNSIVDGKDEKILRFDKVFAVALALAQVVKKETSKKRVGIILPPGLGGLMCNVAVIMAGKIPVNLNFTAGREAINSAIRQGDIDRFLTADIFVRKMQSFPWPPMKQLILIERLIPRLKFSIAKWMVISKILPSALLAALLGVSRKG
ncbi:MAG: 2-acyl-glycerophospho-ethanolamine acyltransferase, partial [Prosthecobacter sp.]